MESIWMNKALILTLALTNYFVEHHAQECGRTEYTDYVGNVTSPRFPSAYAHGLDCIYNLRASGQNSLTILYDTLDLEVSSSCSYDWVEIWCSSNTGSKQKICRLGEERVISYAPCNHAVIRFHTDGSESKSGFRFYYAFQRSLRATSTTKRMTTSSMMTTTLTPTTEATTISIIVTEVLDTTNILNNIATALGPNLSALLILVLVGLLGLSLLSVVALLILRCRSKQSKAVRGKRQVAPSQSTVHYSLDPTEQRGERKDGTERVNNVRDTWMSENDYEHPDDNNDDYENAGEINAVKIGRR